MSWRDRILPASFRGVPFFVDSTSRAGGRRVVVHEAPQREGADLEDTGRLPRRFSVDGYVLGEDFDLELEELIAALERRSAAYPSIVTGSLQLPNVGRMQAACERYRTVQTSSQGRFAIVRMDFVQQGEAPALTKTANPAGKLAAAAGSLEAAATESTVAELNAAGVPSSVTEETASGLASLSAQLAALDVFSGPAKDVTALASSISALVAQASSLATSPLELVTAVKLALGGILDSASNAAAALYAYQVVLGSPTVATSPIAATSNVEQLQAENANALAQLVGLATLAGALRASAEVSWASYEDALAARAELVDAAAALELVAAPQAYSALRGAKAAVVAAIPPPDATLPRLRTERLLAPIPALLLAYRVAGDLDDVDDLIARNRVEHPAFMPAGVDLEVLVDA